MRLRPSNWFLRMVTIKEMMLIEHDDSDYDDARSKTRNCEPFVELIRYCFHRPSVRGHHCSWTQITHI